MERRALCPDRTTGPIFRVTELLTYSERNTQGEVLGCGERGTMIIFKWCNLAWPYRERHSRLAPVHLRATLFDGARGIDRLRNRLRPVARSPMTPLARYLLDT